MQFDCFVQVLQLPKSIHKWGISGDFTGHFVHRIRADCLIKQGDLAEAESEYRHAIRVSQSQKAKPLELRSRYWFTRFLIEQGHPEKEISNLAQVYKWFQEGFDTADLTEVKILLEGYDLSAT